MKQILKAVLGFYLVLVAAAALADPANVAGDTYRLTNYYERDVPDAVDITLVFNDEFMERLGPGDQDKSLLGIEYSIYVYPSFLGTPIELQTGDPSAFAPQNFYIEYDESGNPALMRLEGNFWTLSANIASSTATFQAIIGSPISVALERVVDGRPYDDPRPVTVAPETLELQQAVIDYYTGVITEENPNRLRTGVHILEITKMIRKLQAARAALGEQAPSQPWP
jgi:hypothetical protein